MLYNICFSGFNPLNGLGNLPNEKKKTDQNSPRLNNIYLYIQCSGPMPSHIHTNTHTEREREREHV